MKARKYKELINWGELSRILTNNVGNRKSIAYNRIPKKYQNKVHSLYMKLNEWESDNLIKDNNETKKGLKIPRNKKQ